MAKQYETGNGLTHCPRCGVPKNPTENKCKKCGLELINLDVFKFGISAASGLMKARLKLFEECVNSNDKKIVEERENSLSKAIKWMRGVETKTFVKTGEKDVYRENSRGEIEVRTEDEGYVSKSTEQDFERAETFLKSAVRHGSTEAAVKLAELYASGKLGKSTEFVGDVLSLLCSAAVHGNDKAARALFGRGYELT